MITAAAGIAAGAAGLFQYNRGNFLYDRKLRQEQEFAIFEWRKVQAELWREDVRDIIEMTEKKMDNYLIVSVLQLGACTSLFACGRLEPGTPPWLLHFYMLSLGGAFMYLLMSVWLAMHAGIVAQCASVRMLTQFVRLPVPKWEDFESARTYAQHFESLRFEDMLRVPFTGSLASGQPAAYGTVPKPCVGPGYAEWNQDPAAGTQCGPEGTPHPRVSVFFPGKTPMLRSDLAHTGTTPDLAHKGASGKMGGPFDGPSCRGDSKESCRGDSKEPRGSQCSESGSVDSDEAADDRHPDPWRLEQHGDDRGFYELQRVAVGMRRHIRLARRAALQFQCFDAFARLTMSFGTHQLLFALMHYALGYLSIQDGVFWPAACIATMMACISAMMLHVDFSMTRLEQAFGTLLVFGGMFSTFFAVWLYTTKGKASPNELAMVLPVVYLSNLSWLLNSLRACGLEEEPRTGVVLPMKFRAVLYLDVFGWLSKSPASRSTPMMARRKLLKSQSAEPEPHQEPSPSSSLSGQATCVVEDPPGKKRRFFSRAREMTQKLFSRRRQPAKLLDDTQYEPVPFSDLSTRHAKSKWIDPPSVAPTGPGGEIAHPPEDAFECTTYDRTHDDDFEQSHGSEEIVTGQDRLRPTKMPGHLFKWATLLLVVLWAAALIVPLELLHSFLAQPPIADIYFHEGGEKSGSMREVRAVVGTDVNGLPELIPIVDHTKPIMPLTGGRRLRVEWPLHSAFVPRAIGCDSLGERIVIADDLGLYAGVVEESRPLGHGHAEIPPAAPHRALLADDGRPTTEEATQAASRPLLRLNLTESPACQALEGQAYDDITASCEERDNCSVLVLHNRGESVTQCPFFGLTPGGVGIANGGGSVGPLATSAMNEWSIGTAWLAKDERVESITVRHGCAPQQGYDTDYDDGADGQASCFFIGTSTGRIVELARTQEQNDGVLVPMQTIHAGNDPSTSGSLAYVSGGHFLLSLRYRDGVLQAFTMNGRLAGEWKLPKHTYWLMLSASKDYLFALGVRKNPRGDKRPSKLAAKKALVELHRFPLPAELMAQPMPLTDGKGVQGLHEL